MERDGLIGGLFRPEDAEGVAKLFTEIYGDAYPAKIVYHPEELIAAAERRDQIPIVVRTEEGRVVGYSSMFRAAPDQGVYEKGNGAVAPDFRNRGVISMVFEVVKEVLPAMEEVNVFFGEPVCNHTYIQKAAASVLPMVETAVEVDLMPAEAYVLEQSAPGRVSALLMFMTLLPRPHTVYLPPAYSARIKYIYEGLDDRRTFAEGSEDLPAQATRIETQVFDHARVARMTIHEAGADFADALQAEEARMAGQSVEVTQAWLKLSWPHTGKVVAALKARGYFFGGVLPQWFGDDGFLMQKVRSEPDWQGIHLFSDRAEKILGFVRGDWLG